jgi:hypothetical protein
MVLCSRLRRSNIRTLPSAPQDTNTSTLAAQNRTSNTSLSCAMSWVFAVSVGISHIVQVVSMLEVIIRLGETTFQSSEVIGAVCSGDFELESNARGESFCNGWSLDFRVMVLLAYAWSCGRDQRRRWSPEVARRSVVCLFVEGGSQSIRVTG